MGINSIYSTRTVLRYPRYNVRLNSVRLLAIQISRGSLFHTLGLDILMTLNHNSPFRGPCLKSVWERIL